MLREAADAHARTGYEPHAKHPESDTNGRLDQRVPMPRPEKRRKEVTIQPALIRPDGDCDARDAGGCDDKLSDESRN
jgi:hypothetical protein